jgi:dihydrofolate reductase
MNNSRKLVASHTLDKAEWSNSEVIKGDLEASIRALKAENGRNIYVFGSADLLDSLLGAGLVDEMRLCVAPVALGQGNPHFKRHDAARGFSLLGLGRYRPAASSCATLRNSFSLTLPA